jgi:hypothetical protein
MWSTQPKSHRHIVTLRYSPSENTPTTATVVQKAVAILHKSLQAQRRQWEYCHMGSSRMSECTSEFLVAHSTSKKTPPFLGPKRCN